MKIRVCYPTAHDEFERELSTHLLRATEIDIAVAFATQYGFNFLRDHLAHRRDAKVRFVASVRFPTNLDAMAEFAARYPGRVWIHLGGLTPQEIKGERYQLHSKILSFKNGQGDVDVYIGSHNLTRLALKGVNIEVGTHIQCLETDSPAKDARLHIEDSIREAELFNPRKLDFYKATQAALRISTPSLSGDAIDGFESEKRLIILAEASEPEILDKKGLRLFFSPFGTEATEEILTLRRGIDLYLYPAGGLFSRYSDSPPRQPPLANPIHFAGRITMVNDNNDATVQQRRINAMIRDLQQPVVEPATTIPTGEMGGFQVVALLKRKGERELPIYHLGGSPTAKQRLDYYTTDDILKGIDNADDLYEHYTSDSFAGNHLITEIPSELFEQITLRIPNKDIYEADRLGAVEEADNQRMQDLRQRRRYDLKERSKKKEKWETTYFYYVTHWKKPEPD